MFSYKNPMSNEISEGKYWNLFKFLISMVIAVYLFLNTGDNPGFGPYSEKEKDIELAD